MVREQSTRAEPETRMQFHEIRLRALGAHWRVHETETAPPDPHAEALPPLAVHETETAPLTRMRGHCPHWRWKRRGRGSDCAACGGNAPTSG